MNVTLLRNILFIGSAHECQNHEMMLKLAEIKCKLLPRKTYLPYKAHLRLLHHVGYTNNFQELPILGIVKLSL